MQLPSKQLTSTPGDRTCACSWFGMQPWTSRIITARSHLRTRMNKLAYQKHKLITNPIKEGHTPNSIISKRYKIQLWHRCGLSRTKPRQTDRKFTLSKWVVNLKGKQPKINATIVKMTPKPKRPQVKTAPSRLWAVLTWYRSCAVYFNTWGSERGVLNLISVSC